VDSDDRYADYIQRRNEPSYPFTVLLQKNEALLTGFFKRIALSEFRINWTLPNISAAWGNNTMSIYSRISSGAVTRYLITIADGFYGANELGIALESAIRTATGVTNFKVFISNRPDDLFFFSGGTNQTFAFGNSPSNPVVRQLCDMLNLPNILPSSTCVRAVGTGGGVITVYGTNVFKVGQVVSVTGFTSAPFNFTNGTILSVTPNQFVVNVSVVGVSVGTGIATLGSAPIITALQPYIQSGVANLRPMDYFDVVCNQLTINQQLRDTSSASNTRDMIARIYLDESVPSRVISNTYEYNYPSDTLPDPIATTLTAATINGGSNVVTMTVGSTANLVVGRNVVIKGVTTTTQLNGTAQVIQILSTTSVVVAYPYPITAGTPGFTSATMTAYNSLSHVLESQAVWDDNVNGVTPFVIYRQFQNPKEIRWSGRTPIGNLSFELYDDQGRSIQDLWNQAYPITPADPYNQGRGYANGSVWNATLLVSED
jgi:hypothetical protein